jgi:uncharacterized protein DUF2867
MPARFVSPDPQCMMVLPGADFADAYHLQSTEPGLDAIIATERIMSRLPRWILLLLALRNLLVAPFGLKGSGDHLFPLVSREPGQVVLGMNDKHLDFRLVIDNPGTGEIVGTTLVRTHNLFGRVYLRLVLPFHRLIVPRMMRGALSRPS